jgi:alkylation response protein AidB-like acyl-CoA dehydrogenase
MNAKTPRRQDDSQLDHVLSRIRARAQGYDVSGEWPVEDLKDLAEAGALRAVLPTELGGKDETALQIHLRYEQIAAASLATALVLSQRDSACAIIDAAKTSPLRSELLGALGTNSIFATVGIAQLTTSRQGGPPAMRATRVQAGWRIDGLVPWASGAAESAYVVTGAVVDASADQMLFALPTDAPGVKVALPMELVALRATHTSSITCNSVVIDDRHVLHGPTENVLAGRAKSLPLGQAFLAMGLSRGAIELIREHTSELAQTTVVSFEPQLADIRAAVMEICTASTPPPPAVAAELRGRCNELALRITQSAVAIYKGTALLADHPAQRLAREAMFLLVWSCPNPVIDCTVGLLADG